MARKKKIVVVAALLVGIGAVAAISAPGNRGWGHGRHGGDQHGMGLGMGMGPGQDLGGGRGEFRRGMFGMRDISKDDFDGRTRERFARLDKNSDSVIDASEIEGAMVERRGRTQQRSAGRDGNAGERMLRPFDGDKDGKVTRVEFLDQIKKRFAEADLTNDGKITDDDLPPMLRGRNMVSDLASATGRHGGRGQSMLGVLRGAEVKDGAVTLDAVLVTAAKNFDRHDGNKDGVIDKADQDAMRKDMTDYQIKRFLHAFGADKDGKVSRDQFTAKANERFAAMDANNDGKLTRDELGGRHGMRERMRGWMGRGGRDGQEGSAEQEPPKQ